MKGLEVSEIQLSDLENEGTIGAEYYAPEFLRPYERLLTSNLKTESLGKICDLITDGDHGSADYADSGVPFILSEAVNSAWIDAGACRFITPAHAATLKRSRLETEDVLITKTGVYFGRSAVVPKVWEGANTIAHVGILRLKSGWDSYFVSTFLNCRYGYTQLRRRGIKATRPEIKLVELDGVLVPRPSDIFQETTRQFVLNALRIYEGAIRETAAAEQTLLHALDLKNWHPPKRQTSIRRLNDVFSNGRIDAEFFDPAAVQIVERLQCAGAVALQEIAEVRTGFPWDSGHFIEDRTTPGEPFVRIRDCKPGELAPSDLDKLDASYAKSQGQPKARATDLVVGMDGLKWFYASLLTAPCYVNQRVALIQRDEASDYSPEFLLLCVNSLPGQRQLLRAMTIAHTVGHITLDDLRGLLIPKLSGTIRAEITSSVRAAHIGRREARALLARAQRAVEIAIEESEKAALEFIQGGAHD